MYSSRSPTGNSRYCVGYRKIVTQYSGPSPHGKVLIVRLRARPHWVPVLADHSQWVARHLGRKPALSESSFVPGNLTDPFPGRMAELPIRKYGPVPSGVNTEKSGA